MKYHFNPLFKIRKKFFDEILSDEHFSKMRDYLLKLKNVNLTKINEQPSNETIQRLKVYFF